MCVSSGYSDRRNSYIIREDCIQNDVVKTKKTPTSKCKSCVMCSRKCSTKIIELHILFLLEHLTLTSFTCFGNLYSNLYEIQY
ncbi:hypothetical protein ACJIZ3_014923 [Penstemon smallii]|uniref:Uncharacterized protein n=1 Tax=Penstemon smallii TaxID=265156 RepID=A0ABD3RL79_9LAMI